MFGGGLDRRCACQHHVGVLAGLRLDGTDRHPAGRDGAGLVQHDGVDTANGLEHLRSLDQHPELGAAAGADQDRCRRGQTQRTRAGDDQYRDRRGERGGHRVPGHQPAGHGDRGDHQDGGNEHRRHPISQALNGGLTALRVDNHPGHLGKLGVGTNPAGAQQDSAVGIDRATQHSVTCRHIGRYRLSGHRRGVQCRGALDHGAVGGDTLTGAHHDHVADGQFAGGNPHLGAVAHDGGLLGAQRQQRAQCRTGRPLGLGFGVTAGQQEHRDRGRDFEVHVPVPVPGRPGDHDERRPQVGGQGADRHQGVHRGRAVTGTVQRRCVERVAAPEHNRRGQCENHPLPAGELSGHHHRQRHHRHREDGRADQPGPQLLLGQIVVHVVAGVAVVEHRGVVAGGLDRSDQVLGTHRGSMLDMGLFDREVDGRRHPVEAIEAAFDPGRAG